jgi:FkbM family methyltransferase
MTFRQFVKFFLVHLRLPITKNLAYDNYTRKIMREVLHPGSNCIDIGCHRGEIMDDIRKLAPLGRHFAFEPLPHLFEFLIEKYRSDNVELYSLALFDKKGTTTFNYVVNAPAYSGIRKRHYDFPDAEISELTVETDLLDNIIPEDVKIDFIKIDVEGAEFPVLKGAVKTINRCRPVIIFEFGMGAADYYGSKPEQVFEFLISVCGMNISTLKGYLEKEEPLKRKEFVDLYSNQKEYYFVAY